VAAYVSGLLDFVVRSFSFLAFLALFGSCFADQDSFLTRPDIHGNLVVFTAEGDLWLSDISSGLARRITSDPGVETDAHFSPDGSKIAFTANYDGGADVYVMPVIGGAPKRLTYDATGAQVVGWDPDGEHVLFRTESKLYASYCEQISTYQIFTVAVAGGEPKLVPVPKANFAALNSDRHTLAFVPDSNEWMNWFRYEAGEADKIWLADLDKKKFEKLTDSKGVDTQPTWLGKEIYFVSERSGVRNLWKLDPSTKKASQVTFSTDHPVRHPSSDGKRVVFELGPRLALYDPAVKKTETLSVHLDSDRIHARPYQFPVAQTESLSIGPTGKRVAIVSRGQLVTVPAGEGTMHTIVSDSAQRVQSPAWSPDGKKLAYISDASGEEQLYLADPVDGAQPKQLTTALKGEHGSLVWSPDSKFYSVGARGRHEPHGQFGALH